MFELVTQADVTNSPASRHPDAATIARAVLLALNNIKTPDDLANELAHRTESEGREIIRIASHPRVFGNAFVQKALPKVAALRNANQRREAGVQKEIRIKALAEGISKEQLTFPSELAKRVNAQPETERGELMAELGKTGAFSTEFLAAVMRATASAAAGPAKKTTIYVGLNENTDGERAMLGGDTIAITNEKRTGVLDGAAIHDELTVRKWLVDQGILLPEAKVKTIVAVAKRAIADEVLRLVRVFYRASRGELDITRFSISGHHDANSFYGDMNGSTSSREFFDVCSLFPAACAQVRHLMIAACSGSELLHYRARFPGLQTLWYYSITSPTADKSGAHFAMWNRITRLADAAQMSAEFEAGKLPGYRLKVLNANGVYLLGIDATKGDREGAGEWKSEAATIDAHAIHTKWKAIAIGARLLYPQSARFMEHYLSGKGTQLEIPVNTMLSDLPELRASYEKLVPEMIESCEKTFAPGEANIRLQGQTRSDVYCKSSKDWHWAVGGFSYMWSGMAERVGGDTRIQVNAGIKDTYTWDRGRSISIFGVNVDFDELGLLHRAGLAREFSSSGMAKLATITLRADGKRTVEWATKN